MSTHFEKQMFMPRGVMGPTTCMGMGHEQRIIRWYSKEWAEFMAEVSAYKHRVLEEFRTLQLRAAEARRKCPHCQSTYMAMMRLRRFQRGSVGQTVQASAAQQGVGGDCSFTASTIPNLFDFTISPTIARTRARLHTDGDWYSTDSSTGFGTPDGTWDGDCAINEYDSRWNNTDAGDAPNAAVQNTDGTWRDASVGGSAIGYDNNSAGGGALVATFDMQIRDGSSLNVLFTDAFTMNADQDAKN